MRIAHVISEYSRHEAMGRTIAETVARVDAEHHLVATRAHDGHDAFHSVHEVGGTLTTFAFRRGEAVSTALDEIRPDIVHVHGGALAPLWVRARSLRGRTMVMSVYGWPRVPRPSALRRASLRQLTTSNVLRPRVVASTLLPTRVASHLIRTGTVHAVLSPDPDARQRLAGCGVPVLELPSGAALSEHRAHFDEAAPVVLFAGRSEMVRGIDDLLAAFHIVRSAIPAARLRLLLIPTAELPAVLAAIDRSGLGASVEVRTDPVADLAHELSLAQVGVWPFKFDYTTSPPAMALAEAMAVGLPVVSTEVTCVRSIARDGHNADLVGVGDIGRLARSIVDVATDGDRWLRRAEAGLQTIEFDASWANAAQQTDAAYAIATDRPTVTA